MVTFILLQSQNAPVPDNYFWYSLAIVSCVALISLITWAVNRWIDSIHGWMRKADERFEAVFKELTEVRKENALNEQILKMHSKSLEQKDSEANKLANEMILALQFLRGGGDHDDDNPTVRRFREKR